MFEYLQTEICPKGAKCFNTPIFYTTSIQFDAYGMYAYSTKYIKNLFEVAFFSSTD